jgi:hypothetical protein
MLPYWSIVKHKSRGFAQAGKITFESDEFKKTCARHNCNSFAIEMEDTILDFGNDPCWIGIIGNLTINDKDEMEIDWIDRIPWQYQDYKSLYYGEVSNVLPPHQSFDYAIDIQAGKEPTWGPIYSLSGRELSVLKEYIKEMLDGDTIRPGKSSAGAPTMFVQKPHGKCSRLCVDYRGLNMVTIMNMRPLPLMNEIQDRVQGAMIFTKINLKAGFNII